MILTFYKLTAGNLVYLSDYRTFHTYSLFQIFTVPYQVVSCSNWYSNQHWAVVLLDWHLKITWQFKWSSPTAQGRRKCSLPTAPLGFDFQIKQWMFNICVQVHVEKRYGVKRTEGSSYRVWQWLEKNFFHYCESEHLWFGVAQLHCLLFSCLDKWAREESLSYISIKILAEKIAVVAFPFTPEGQPLDSYRTPLFSVFCLPQV